jgi:hypothetical protein
VDYFIADPDRHRRIGRDGVSSFMAEFENLHLALPHA